MSLEKLTTSIREMTPDEKSDDVNELIKSINDEFNSLTKDKDKLQEANDNLSSELKNEKSKVHSRNDENASNRWNLKKAKEQIKDLETQITDLKNGGAEDVKKLKSDILEQDKSLATLTEKLKRKTVRDKSLLINKLSHINDQELIAKIEKVLPIDYDKEADNPAFKTDKITDDQIDKSLDKLAELELLGVLKTPTPSDTDTTPPHKQFNSKRYTSEELETLAENHPKEYEKLRKQKGFFE